MLLRIRLKKYSNWKEDPETVKILKSRAQEDENEYVRGAAVQELARGWKEDSETVKILKSRAQHDDSKLLRIAAVQKLVRGWKDDPEIQQWLEELERNRRD